MGGLRLPAPAAARRAGHGGRIERIDLEYRRGRRLYDECDGHPLRGPNDIVFDAHGGFWFTDHGVRLERSTRPHRRLLRPARRLGDHARRSSRWTRRTASACRRTARASTWPRRTLDTCLVVEGHRAGRGRGGARRLPARRRRCSYSPGGPAGLRLARRGRRGPRLPRDASSTAASAWWTARAASWSSSSRPTTSSRRTSASAATTCGRPTSRCRAPGRLALGPVGLAGAGSCPRTLRIERGFRAAATTGSRLLPSGQMSEAATLDSLPLLASGKVREMYDAGRPAPDGRLRPDLDLRRRPPRRRSPARARCSPASRSSGSSGPAHICRNHVVSYTDVPEEAKGRALLVEKLEMFPVECVARGYITGSGWKDYQATGAVCGIELPAGPAGVGAAARADLHAGHEGRRRRPRRERGLRPRGRDPRRPAAARGAAPPHDRALHVRRRPRARARDHPGRHQVRVRPRRRRRDRARRRGAHARLVALLAGRRLRGRPRPAARSTSSTCATGRPAPAGTRRRPRPALPDEVVEGTRAALRGRLRAHHRRAVLAPGSSGAGAA